MHNLEKLVANINSVLIKVLNFILSFLSIVLIFVVVANVICRYVLRNPLFWATEFACYLLVYLIFFGAALALYKDEHVSVNTEGIKIPLVLKNIFEKVGILFNYVFIILLIVFGISISCKNMRSYTGSLPIPMGIVYLAAPISGVAMLLMYTERIIKKKVE